MPAALTRKQSIWIGVGLLTSFFVGSAFLIRYQNANHIPIASSNLTKESVEGAVTPSAETTPGGEGAGFVLNDFHRSLVRDGRTVWEIFGQRGRYAPGNNLAEIEKPRLSLTSKTGDHVLLTAGRAVLTLRGNELEKADLFDDVVMHYKDDTTLKTSMAYYSKITNSVLIPVYLEIENEGVLTSGSRLTADLEKREFIIDDGVKSIIKPREKKER